MTQGILFDSPASPSPFAQRCAELGIKLTERETLNVKGIEIKTPFMASLQGVHATSNKSERDAVVILCSALGIIFEKI